ncbi:MAG TPA: hypothetical protein VGN19_03370, partial [Pedococcus sp.]|nr:hypothetical protein [Pedococcus sp.]
MPNPDTAATPAATDTATGSEAAVAGGAGTATSPAVSPARMHRALESLHSLVYFAPEVEEELVAAGLRPGRMCYFASRSAPLGAVTAGVTAATFYNFNPELVARHIPRAWTLASPEQVISARLAGVDRAMRRLLGEALGTPAVAEAAGLARAATVGLDPAGRPLYAGHAGLDWPEAPHLELWHAATLLREFRGDGHLAALLSSGLSGIEAIITHTATGRGFTVESAKLLRGWSDEQWEAAID